MVICRNRCTVVGNPGGSLGFGQILLRGTRVFLENLFLVLLHFYVTIFIPFSVLRNEKSFYFAGLLLFQLRKCEMH